MLRYSTNIQHLTRQCLMWIIVVTIVLGSAASVLAAPDGQDETSWLVMYYGDADDELIEYDVLTDANEIELVGSGGDVRFVAQLDRFKGGYTGDGNWTSTKRFFVTYDET